VIKVKGKKSSRRSRQNERVVVVVVSSSYSVEEEKKSRCSAADGRSGVVGPKLHGRSLKLEGSSTAFRLVVRGHREQQLPQERKEIPEEINPAGADNVPRIPRKKLRPIVSERAREIFRDAGRKSDGLIHRGRPIPRTRT